MKSCKGVVGLSLLLTAMAAIGLPASAAQLKAKTAVLVHGAFADGSCWQKVIPYLEKAGLKVIAVQNPLDSLDNDVAATKRAIRNAEGPVVLVGHSWAGAVITEAGNDEKVKSLVYVAAYAPQAKTVDVRSARTAPPSLRAKQSSRHKESMDCFAASAPGNDDSNSLQHPRLFLFRLLDQLLADHDRAARHQA